MLTLDLGDPQSPFAAPPLRRLPLYYPLKYGMGGAAVQYEILSDTEIRILYLSDRKPDDPDDQYVRGNELPAGRFKLVPLKYEEARLMAFLDANRHFNLSRADQQVLSHLRPAHHIGVGGPPTPIKNAGDIVCHNHQCDFFGKRVSLVPIATVPPIPVSGRDEFWHEYQGGAMRFCYGYCACCQTLIAFNVAD